MKQNKNLLLWVLVIGILIILAAGVVSVVLAIQKTSDTATRAIELVEQIDGVV